jgi:hypothetical protein
MAYRKIKKMGKDRRFKPDFPKPKNAKRWKDESYQHIDDEEIESYQHSFHSKNNNYPQVIKKMLTTHAD